MMTLDAQRMAEEIVREWEKSIPLTLGQTHFRSLADAIAQAVKVERERLMRVLAGSDQLTDSALAAMQLGEHATTPLTPDLEKEG